MLRFYACRLSAATTGSPNITHDDQLWSNDAYKASSDTCIYTRLTGVIENNRLFSKLFLASPIPKRLNVQNTSTTRYFMLNMLFLLDNMFLFMYNDIKVFELYLTLIQHMIINIQCVSTKC